MSKKPTRSRHPTAPLQRPVSTVPPLAVDERGVVARAGGAVSRSYLQKARLTGADAPPFIRVGPHKVLYLLEDVDRWLGNRPRLTSTSAARPA